MPAFALTHAYADFIAGIDRANIPELALQWARTGFVDTFGVALAGAREPVVDILRQWVLDQQGRPAAALFGRDARVPEAMAACVNSTAAHALDFDDFAFSNHPSAVLVPVVLALGQAQSQPVPGMKALRAYIAGYEVWADAFSRESDLYYDQGWHPTAVFGVLGAAAAASVMLGLQPMQCSHALALAASGAGGVFENFGTMAKPFHGGHAAQVGVQSAMLAHRGLSASGSALEGDRGMLRAFSPRGQVDRTRPFVPGEPWRIMQHGLNLKRYPVVGAAQRCIDAALALRSDIRIDVRRVRSIAAHVSRRHAAVMPYALPQDALQAKFSLEFAVACALMHGRVGFGELDDLIVRAPEMQALMRRVHVHTTEAFEPGWRDAAPFDQVELTMDDGSSVRSPEIRRPLGHADRPLSDAQLAEKFITCAAHVGISGSSAMHRFERLRTLHADPDIRSLDLATPRPATP